MNLSGNNLESHCRKTQWGSKFIDTSKLCVFYCNSRFLNLFRICFSELRRYKTSGARASCYSLLVGVFSFSHRVVLNGLQAK